MNGYGKIKYENGDYYSGQWKNDKKNGNGNITYSNGIKYMGSFKNN